MNPELLSILLALIAALCLGTSISIMRYFTDIGVNIRVSIILKLGLMAIGSLLVAAFNWKLTLTPLIGGMWVGLVLIGIAGNYASYRTFKHHATGIGASLMATGPIFMLPAAVLLGVESFHLVNVILTMLVVGVLIYATTGKADKTSKKTYLWPILAALSFGMRGAIQATMLATENIGIFTLHGLTLLAVVLTYLLITRKKHWETLTPIWQTQRGRVIQLFTTKAVLELGFNWLTLFAFTLTAYPTRVLAIVETNPIMATVMAWLLFREKLPVKQLIAILAIVGLIIIMTVQN